jgi:hypothetical protein
VIGRGRCRNHQLARCTGHARCDGIIPVCAARRGLACGRPTAATVYLCLCKRQRQQSNNCSRYRLPGTQNGGIIKHCAAPDLPFGRPFTVSALCCHCSPAPHPARILAAAHAAPSWPRPAAVAAGVLSRRAELPRAGQSARPGPAPPSLRSPRAHTAGAPRRATTAPRLCSPPCASRSYTNMAAAMSTSRPRRARRRKQAPAA